MCDFDPIIILLILMATVEILAIVLMVKLLIDLWNIPLKRKNKQ